jgi:hypothetical protein
MVQKCCLVDINEMEKKQKTVVDTTERPITIAVTLKYGKVKVGS